MNRLGLKELGFALFALATIAWALWVNPDGYLEETRANIIGRTWAHPAYAGNCIYARSDTEIVCVLLPRAK